MIYTELRAFHFVAKFGGFTAAAKVVNISQPTLSTQVKPLKTATGLNCLAEWGVKHVLHFLAKSC